jgi:glutaredoxin 3
MPGVRIYTTRACPYCVNAKRLLGSLGAAYEEITLDHNPELWDRLSRENGGWQTVPMVFVGQEFLGGFDDIAALHRAGRLVPKLRAVEAVAS